MSHVKCYSAPHMQSTLWLRRGNRTSNCQNYCDVASPAATTGPHSAVHDSEIGRRS